MAEVGNVGVEAQYLGTAVGVPQLDGERNLLRLSPEAAAPAVRRMEIDRPID